ncbi:hypothetical protein ASE35_11750 [Lysobacter sp. Root916]|uniref:DUF4259 domain-containing protein n=1 Tax=Lysobacter sp. Root916 TaxID=1736606 RepID=UPI0007090CFB|nr:DUF4259 domain-containing protein [Lysobacter sp. Root916]KRD34374.1 hypothetical protein ASE35_11750 [Lysobacter sp. Root916]
MGAWGIGSFDNDHASDWLLDLIEGEDLAPMRAAIAQVLAEDDYLDSDLAVEALAAIEVLAATLGRPTAAIQDEAEFQAWLAELQLQGDPSLVPEALRALERILAPESELRELWEETEDYEDWCADVARLRSHVGA